jgi:hypothetical protein
MLILFSRNVDESTRQDFATFNLFFSTSRCPFRQPAVPIKIGAFFGVDRQLPPTSNLENKTKNPKMNPFVLILGKLVFENGSAYRSSDVFV